MVDRSKFKCYNCNEPEHFASECRKPKQAKGQREAYDELKQKYEALLRKQQGKLTLQRERVGMTLTMMIQKNMGILH